MRQVKKHTHTKTKENWVSESKKEHRDIDCPIERIECKGALGELRESLGAQLRRVRQHKGLEKEHAESAHVLGGAKVERRV